MLYEQRMIPCAAHNVSIRLYIPDVWQPTPENIKRTTLVIFGGGGLTHISPRETEPVAIRFASLGYNCVTVEYRYAPNRWPLPAYDAAAAVAYIREHADELHSDPNRIAVMGFSAGAYVAGTIGLRWNENSLWEPLGIPGCSIRPNTMLLCYPVITAGDYAHRGTFTQLSGSEDFLQHKQFSLEQFVTSSAPATFIWHTWDDQTVPVENSLILASALRKADVSTELHIYQHGSHGLALCDETTALYNDQICPDCAGWVNLADAFLKRL